MGNFRKVIKRIFLYFICSMVFAPLLFASELVNVEDVSLPFAQGEKLSYRVSLKRVKIGKSQMVFHGPIEHEGKQVYHITFDTEIFNVRDLEKIYVDKKNFLPLIIDRDIVKIGMPDEKIRETYDQEKFKVHISKIVWGRKKNMVIEKDSYIHNVILLTYYFRVLPEEHFNKKFHVSLPTAELDISFMGKEKVVSSLGTYEAFVFKGEPKNFKFYISADDKRLPLRIENPAYYMVLEGVGNIEDDKDNKKKEPKTNFSKKERIK